MFYSSHSDAPGGRQEVLLHGQGVNFPIKMEDYRIFFHWIGKQYMCQSKGEGVCTYGIYLERLLEGLRKATVSTKQEGFTNEPYKSPWLHTHM